MLTAPSVLGFHGQRLIARPPPSSVPLIASIFAGCGVFLSGVGLTPETLLPCSNWVMRVRRLPSPASKTSRSPALALIACSYASRALVRSGSCLMNAVAFLVNSFTASVYVVMVADDDG